MTQAATATNHLIHETSLYLKQHAGNPVDWHAWGPEALDLARRLDRPIFLSIGYSACHWCHVMEHESFENAEIAKILNEHFVSIKVDREERPDLDQIYMNAVQILTQMLTGQAQGGWPMSVFLTPDLKPFYGGTYYPPDDRYGRPGFKRILTAIADSWRNRRQELLVSADRITEHLQGMDRSQAAPGELEPGLIRAAIPRLAQMFDPKNGGFGSAPKFPHPLELKLLLRTWKRFGDEQALHMTRLTLDRMAMGGMYDHLGGGFHRYSTDQEWLVPHFEKMLYDNALLSVAYLEGYQATGEAFYREVVEEILDYVRREMTSPEGPFFSTQDADSEGVEGKFFVWSLKELEEALGKELAETFTYVYDVTDSGNWEGHNILHRLKSYDQYARLLKVPEPELRRLLKQAKAKLFEVRSRRIAPARDEKVLTSWCGLMIDAFAQASGVLARPDYAATAQRAADFILRRMRLSDRRLLHTYSAGSEPKLNAYLEDYAFFINALLSLYEATFEPRWIEAALDLAEVMIDQFWDAAEAGFFFTGKDHETLIARTKDPQDSSIPSGNSMAVTALLRLTQWTGRIDLREKAEASLRLFRGLMAASPMAVGQMLNALDFCLGPVQEFAVVGDPESAEGQRVLRAIFKDFRPNKVVAWKTPAEKSDKLEELLPLLKGKKPEKKVAIYICQNFTCQAPLVGAEALEKALENEKQK